MTCMHILNGICADHLRPLWPAIGTLVVPFALIALMLVGTLWDKMIAKFCVGENSSMSSKAENRRIRSRCVYVEPILNLTF